MTPALAHKLERLRRALESDRDSVIAGEVRPGLGFEPHVGSRAYGSLLARVDGGRFGGIDLWRHDEVAGAQFYVDEEVPGGTARWLCVGRITTDVILIDRNTGEVRLFAPPYSRPDPQGENLGDLDTFLDEIATGARYLAVVGQYPPEWIDRLRRLGFLP
jgi:hypothetical protein